MQLHCQKTKKKGKEQKESLVNAIREAVELYGSIYVFSFQKMRNLKFKGFRDQLKSSSRLLHESLTSVLFSLNKNAILLPSLDLVMIYY